MVYPLNTVLTLWPVLLAFILDTTFEGVAVSAQSGTMNRCDNDNCKASFSFGRAIGEKPLAVLCVGL